MNRGNLLALRIERYLFKNSAAQPDDQKIEKHILKLMKTRYS